MSRDGQPLRLLTLLTSGRVAGSVQVQLAPPGPPLLQPLLLLPLLPVSLLTISGCSFCKTHFLTLGGISGGNSCTHFTSHINLKKIFYHIMYLIKKITKSVYDEDFKYNNVLFK